MFFFRLFEDGRFLPGLMSLGETPISPSGQKTTNDHTLTITGLKLLPGQTAQSLRTVTPDEHERLLIQKARTGDVTCFGEIVKRYERAVHAIVQRMMGPREDVADVVQEVFLAAWRGLGGFRGDARFGTWLHTITVNATLKRLKALKRSEFVSIDDEENGFEDRLVASNTHEPFEALCSSEERLAVRRALGRLSDSHRMTVVLYYFEGYSCDEISQMMNCSVGTVWSRLHYACRKLKSCLADESVYGLEFAAGREGGER